METPAFWDRNGADHHTPITDIPADSRHLQVRVRPTLAAGRLKFSRWTHIIAVVMAVINHATISWERVSVEWQDD